MALEAIAKVIAEWNKNAFIGVNSGMANPVFDWIMPLMREPNIWAPVYIFFAAFFIMNYKKQGAYIILFGLFTFVLSDQISASIIKPLFAHPRPCNDVIMASHVRLLVPCGAGYSFPSAHATNHFAFSLFLAALLGDKIRWLTPVVITWAAVVCFAQVYVGIHYPLDVIGGALLGILIGYWTGYLCKITVKIPVQE